MDKYGFPCGWQGQYETTTKCNSDPIGYYTDAEIQAIAKVCPIACKQCVPKAEPRGTEFPECTMPANGSHIFPNGHACLFLKPLTVQSGKSLTVSVAREVGDADANVNATISGGDATVLFIVNGGNLTLMDMILTFGKSEGSGGALLIQNGGNGGKLSFTRLVRTIVQHSAAALSGGAAFISGIGCSLSVEDASFVGNTAGVNGGAIYALDGACVNIGSGTSSITDNTAKDSGGGVAVQGSTTSLVGDGLTSRLLLTNNVAKVNGGACLFQDGATFHLSRGATVVAKENIAEKRGGGVSIEDTNSSLFVTGTGSKLSLEKNTAGEYAGGL